MLKSNQTRKIGDILLIILVLLIPILTLQINFINHYSSLYESYLPTNATIYYFNIDISKSLPRFVFSLRIFLVLCVISVSLLLYFKFKQNNYTFIKLNGNRILIFLILYSIIILFILFHNLGSMNHLAEEYLIEIYYLGIKFPNNIATLDYLIFPIIILLLITIILVYIKK